MQFAKLSRYLAPAFLTIFYLVPHASLAELSVIVSEKNKDLWTEARVHDAYTGRLKSKAVIIEQAKEQAAYNEFREKFLGKTENQLKLQWSILIFSGGRAPLHKANDRDVFDYLKNHDNAIGYVSSEFFKKEIQNHKSSLVEIFKVN